MKVDLTGLRKAGTRGLVGTIVLIVLGAAAPAYLTYQHLQDRQILADRGVRVEAQVTGLNQLRHAPDTVDVRPVDPPYFESVLDRAPGLSVGDRVDVIVDPVDPGRIAVVDQPLIDHGDLVFVAIDLVCLLLLLGLLLPLGELVRRTWVRYRHSPAPARRAPDADQSSAPRRRPLAGMEPPQIVLLLVAAPVAATAVAGLFAADAAETAESLRTSGATTQAVVDTSTWARNDGGWLDVSFRLPDGTVTSASVHANGRAHYEGESVDIVYAQSAPRIARLAGQQTLPADLWLPFGALGAFAATALVSVPTAVVALVRRSQINRSADERVAAEVPDNM